MTIMMKAQDAEEQGECAKSASACCGEVDHYCPDYN